MRNLPADALSMVGVRDRDLLERDLSAACADDPPTPSQIFTRLGVMLLVALCFGLASQFLVALTPHRSCAEGSLGPSRSRAAAE